MLWAFALIFITFIATAIIGVIIVSMQLRSRRPDVGFGQWVKESMQSEPSGAVPTVEDAELHELMSEASTGEIPVDEGEPAEDEVAAEADEADDVAGEESDADESDGDEPADDTADATDEADAAEESTEEPAEDEPTDDEQADDADTADSDKPAGDESADDTADAAEEPVDTDETADANEESETDEPADSDKPDAVVEAVLATARKEAPETGIPAFMPREKRKRPSAKNARSVSELKEKRRQKAQANKESHA